MSSRPNRVPRDLGFRSANDEDDPYAARGVPFDPTVCPQRKAVFTDGAWRWMKAPSDAAIETCPACQRIRDDFPAGYITIKGEFFAQHKQEIIALLKTREAEAKSERPLQRIMAIDEKRHEIEVKTTDSQIARTLAEALHSQWKGDLKLRYSRDENLLRAVWKK